MPEIIYPFRTSERIVFAEIYFPKRAAYQGAIFTALRKGYAEDAVRTYLHGHAADLLEEMKAYPGLLDPHQYDAEVREAKPLTVADAEARIAQYRSSFQGWSTYSVDGVFFSEKGGRMFEEATQVVRILFRFIRPKRRKRLWQQAEDAGCTDVVRSILYWTITRIGRLDEETGWSVAERELFLANHTAWTEPKRAFAEEHFGTIAKEAQRWVDDGALFLFGYLVRNFWSEVLAQRMYEEEIWVTSHFTMNLNVIKRTAR